MFVARNAKRAGDLKVSSLAEIKTEGWKRLIWDIASEDLKISPIDKFFRKEGKPFTI